MQKKIDKNQLVVEPAKALWRDFERHLDTGRLESGARKFLSGGLLPPLWERLGEGADQTVIGPAQSQHVICLPKNAFLERLGKGGRVWLSSVAHVAREARRRLFEADFPTLIPPVSVLSNPCALIMVRGIPAHGSTPPPELVENTRKMLGELGFKLEDSPQFARAGEGVWFIYDWSDLRHVAGTARQDFDSSISF